MKIDLKTANWRRINKILLTNWKLICNLWKLTWKLEIDVKFMKINLKTTN